MSSSLPMHAPLSLTARQRSQRQHATAVPEYSGAATGISSQSLLQGRRELCIQHGEEQYRLRHTRNGKLILTK